jgi:predicted nucleic acid-binding protein
VILIDTSAWIAFFRGNAPLADRVDVLIESNDAAICGPIWTELRRGLRNPAERKRVLPLLASCHDLNPPPDLWNAAGDLGYLLARKGVTAKSFDLLIATHALHHDVALLTDDSDFMAMREHGVPLLLA